MTRVFPCPTCNGKGWVLNWVAVGPAAYKLEKVDCDVCGSIGLENDSDAESERYRREDTDSE